MTYSTEQTGNLFRAVAIAHFRLSTIPDSGLPAARDELLAILTEALAGMGVKPKDEQLERVRAGLELECKLLSADDLTAAFFS